MLRSRVCSSAPPQLTLQPTQACRHS
jgi:hypothetical protein